MASIISLERIPTQKFSVPLGGNNYDIRIFMLNDHMAYDLSINNSVIVSGFKIVNEIPLLPYKYQEVSGNLLLIIPEDELADYNRFGITQTLVYMTESEMDIYRERAGI